MFESDDMTAAVLDMMAIKHSPIRGKNNRCHAADVMAMLWVKIPADGKWFRIGGVNGAPPMMPKCTEVGCEWVAAGVAGTGRPHARHLHAEAAAICHAAKEGFSTDFARLVVSTAPCPSCANLIVASGIVAVGVPSSGVPDGWDVVRMALDIAGVRVQIVEVN